MRDVFEDYLFAQGYFVAEEPVADRGRDESVVAALGSLWYYARIRITACPELANMHMLQVAQRNLGLEVPEPFYRGFPESVRTLEPTLRLTNQLLHYYRTYYLGDFSRIGHALFEARYERLTFAENVKPKEFAIITPAEADGLLRSAAEGFLCSTRPLNDSSQELLETYLASNPAFHVERCACKDTAIRILLSTRDSGYSRFIELSDVIRLVEWLHELQYQGVKLVRIEYHQGLSTMGYVPVSELKKLSLRNRDRKLIIAVLDQLFARGDVDIDTCLEKKRLWNGLLHHLHYRPSCAEAREFCAAIRGKGRRSAYATMERCLAAGDVRGATDALLDAKGPGAVLRHLDHLLSRIDKTQDSTQVESDIAYVLAACSSRNRIILVQLLLKYGTRRYQYFGVEERTFVYVRLGQLAKHYETTDEAKHRKSLLPGAYAERVEAWVRDQLARACHGSLGKVYVSDDLRHAMVPLQEGASMGGFGTLPRGTRIQLPADKKVRAFIYWRRTNDIDLSCFGLYDSGNVDEFSWRTNHWSGLHLPVYSGDQTSGYYGGSEYFDVELSSWKGWDGESSHYLLFCGNVYSYETFDQCVCRAGYMLRDLDDSGEVFEPSTVQTSFTIDCASRAAYLFALDLQDPALIWLNIGARSFERIAGMDNIRFLQKYLHTTEVFNVRDFARMLATEVVDTPDKADVVFADATAGELELREGQELVRPRDTARLLELLNG